MGTVMEERLNMEKNIILVGVGGQGLITLGRILGTTAINKGIKALTAETHGMAQRGGSVTVHVRIGDVESPLIPMGRADAILGLELIETVRNLTYANKKTILILNNRVIKPQIPKIKIPETEKLIKIIKETGLQFKLIDALKLAIEAGSEITQNVVMLGALIKTNILKDIMNLKDVEETIKMMFSHRIAEINIKALKLGFEA